MTSSCVASPAETPVEPVEQTSRRGRPKLVDAEQVERRLIDAARAVFVLHGYEATTMDAVAAAARTSKRTLYSRFPSKELLFAAVVTDHITRSFSPVQHELNETVAPSTTPCGRREATGTDGGLDGLRNCLIRLGRAFVAQAVATESRALDRAVFAAARTFPELARRLHQEGFERAVAIVGELLVRHGAARAELAAQVFYAMLVLAPMRGESIDQAQPDVDAVVEFVMAGAALPAEAG